MQKRLLFVNGPSQDMCDRFFGWPTSLLYAIAPSIQAIRSGVLACNFVPEIFDPIWYIEGVNDEEVNRNFREKVRNVDVVCASATYDALYPTLQLFRQAKAVNPQTITILGGPHFDEVHGIPHFNDVVSVPALVDYGIAGDGDLALLALLQYIQQDETDSMTFNEVPGDATIYAGRQALRTHGGRLPLDDLPFLPVELADQSRHRNDFDVFHDEHGIIPTVQMIAKRGCGYHCNYCSERSELAYPNARSIESILREVQLRKDQGFRAVFFDDSTFGLYPRLKELLKQLASSGMRFGCLNRFNHLLDHRLLEAYREAGFMYFYCAIEQFDDNALSLMGKAQDERRIRLAMELLGKHGFQVGVSLLYGLPYETLRSVNRSRNNLFGQ